MNIRIQSLALVSLFAASVADVQAYGVVPLVLYSFGRMIGQIGQNDPHFGQRGTRSEQEHAGLEQSTESQESSFFQEGSREKITFSDIIGAPKAKAALMDIINALKHPEVYQNIGAKMPKGVLLEGNPGNGKTLLAKALANEAGVSFIAINGADFSDKYMGEGVRKVKELFAQAREKAPCIIFIDEIDAIGARGQEFGGGAQTENNRVITELLTQLDGMSTNTSRPIIVVGATNSKARLDPALLRSGRFDVAVRVKDPTLQDRAELLKFYGKRLKLSGVIDFDKIAAQLDGFSGADCANLVNQAALCAIRRKSAGVEQADFIEALNTRNIRKS